MGKIYYLIGKSASGKDSIFRDLIQRPELGLKKVVLYTTRPIRTGEVEGTEYHFIDEEKVAELEEAGRIIELRAYQTVYGIWKYMTVKDEMFDPEQADYLMAGTLESYVNIRNYFGRAVVEPLYVYVDDGVRLMRALERERSQANPKYAEMCRRFLADEEDFAEDKLEKEEIATRFENRELKSCCDAIAEEILRLKAEV